MPSPGLCHVTAAIRDPSQLSEADFNAFYDTEHVPDILRHGFSNLALRYRNADPGSSTPYLALYSLDDVGRLSSPETARMMDELRVSRVLGGRDHHGLIAYGVSAWTKVQTFEGAGEKGQARGQTLVAVFMEPGEGGEAEADLDAWYRGEHLEMLSKCQGYRRSTRYRRDGDGDGGPRFLALHEYACEPNELPAEQIVRTRETEWARRVIGSAKTFEREVWGLIGAQGEDGAEL